MALTDREEVFCLEYVVDWNPTAAAARAGFAPEELKDLLSLLERDDVRLRIEQLSRRASPPVFINADRILRELFYLATYDVGDLFDGDELLNLKEMPEGQRRAISSFQVDRTTVGFDEQLELPVVQRVTKVKLASKERALELLGKYKKMFGDDLQLLTSGSLTVNFHINGVQR